MLCLYLFAPFKAANSLLPTPPSPYSLSDVLFSLPTRLPSTAPRENGSPHVIILASSGQRCADLVRELRALIPGSTSVGGGAEEKKGKKGGKKAGAAGRGEIAKVRHSTTLPSYRMLVPSTKWLMVLVVQKGSRS